MDLVQEGILGVLQAVDHFDLSQDVRFTTYAVWWIRHTISRTIQDRERIVRLPVHLHGQRAKVFATKERLEQKLGRRPEALEIAQSTGVSIQSVDRALRIGQPVLSLDYEPENGRGLRETLPDGRIRDMVDMWPEDLRALVDKVLSKQEAEVLRQRSGLDRDEQTLTEVGNCYGLNRERIRQIQELALNKLRRALNLPAKTITGLLGHHPRREGTIMKSKHVITKARVYAKDLSAKVIEVIDRCAKNGLGGADTRASLKSEGYALSDLPSINAIRVMLRDRQGNGPKPATPKPATPKPATPKPATFCRVRRQTVLGPEAAVPEVEAAVEAPPVAVASQELVLYQPRFVVYPDGRIETPDARSAVEVARLLACPARP
jgi:RNA polymerase sigma factor (sigma-70 family)